MRANDQSVAQRGDQFFPVLLDHAFLRVLQHLLAKLANEGLTKQGRHHRPTPDHILMDATHGQVALVGRIIDENSLATIEFLLESLGHAGTGHHFSALEGMVGIEQHEQDDRK